MLHNERFVTPLRAIFLARAGKRGTHVRMSAVPLDLAPLLRDLIFDRLETVALTSATLAASGDFGFLESRLGLDQSPSPVTVREIFPSPFDYREQCLFGVPDDIPDPREDQAGHDQAVCRVVVDLAHASGGGMFTQLIFKEKRAFLYLWVPRMGVC